MREFRIILRTGALGAALIGLAACGGGDDSASNNTGGSTANTAANNTAETQRAGSSVDIDTVAEAARAAAEALKIDASSAEAFKASLAAMKDGLPPDQTQALTQKLAELMAEAPGASGDSALKRAADLASGRTSMYAVIGSQLDGLTFDEIMAR